MEKTKKEEGRGAAKCFYVYLCYSKLKVGWLKISEGWGYIIDGEGKNE